MTEPGSDMSEVQQAAEQVAEPAPPVNGGDNGQDAISADGIEAEALIAEVKKRPILYLHAQNEYFEKTYRQKGWEGVCQSLFEGWDKFSPKKKKDTGKKVQNKWHKLKECFFKSSNGGLNKISPGAKAHKPYYQSMTFLVTNTGDPNAPLNQMDQAMAPPVEEQDVPPQFEVPTVPQVVAQLPSAPIDEFQPTQKQYCLPVVHPSMHSSMHRSMHTPMHQSMQQAMHQAMNQAMHDAMTPEQSNPNTHFTHMLFTLLNKLSSEQQYTAWPEILRVVKEAEGKKRISVLPAALMFPSFEQGPSNVVAPNYFPHAEVALRQPVYASTSQVPRPTNPQGELIYPETDHEDEDA